jgi:hypothetical protein
MGPYLDAPRSLRPPAERGIADEQIPPACAADLLAIAQALQNDR